MWIRRSPGRSLTVHLLPSVSSVKHQHYNSRAHTGKLYQTGGCDRVCSLPAAPWGCWSGASSSPHHFPPLKPTTFCPARKCCVCPRGLYIMLASTKRVLLSAHPLLNASAWHFLRNVELTPAAADETSSALPTSHASVFLCASLSTRGWWWGQAEPSWFPSADKGPRTVGISLKFTARYQV